MAGLSGVCAGGAQTDTMWFTPATRTHAFTHLVTVQIRHWKLQHHEECSRVAKQMEHAEVVHTTPP
jgi:hypothetical protein